MTEEGRELPKTISQKCHNPGNIRFDPRNAWIGQLPTPYKGFARFSSEWYGTRAVYHLLKTYREKHRCKTVGDFIYRWAPPSENDEMAYLHFLSTEYDLMSWTIVANTTDFLILGIAIMDYESSCFDRASNSLVSAWKVTFERG